MTAGEAVRASGLNYAVVKKPMEALVKMWVRHDDYAIVRKDTGDVLGILGDSDEPVQNNDAFTFFDPFVIAGEAVYETAGVIGRGGIWILARLPGCITIHGNDIVNKYLLLTHRHEGHDPIRVKVMPIRAVCSNTLTGALQGAGEVRISRTSHTAESTEKTRALLGLSTSLYDQLEVTFNRMALRKLSDQQLLEYLKVLVPDDEESSTKVQRIRRAILELYESGQGADLSRGSLWGAFNCVTEYTDHQIEGDPATHLESMWFGRGEQLKDRAFHLAERMMQN